MTYIHRNLLSNGLKMRSILQGLYPHACDDVTMCVYSYYNVMCVFIFWQRSPSRRLRSASDHARKRCRYVSVYSCGYVRTPWYKTSSECVCACLRWPELTIHVNMHTFTYACISRVYWIGYNNAACLSEELTTHHTYTHVYSTRIYRHARIWP